MIRWFHRGRIKHRNYKQILSEFSRSLALIMDSEQLRANIISKIQQVVHVDKVLLFLYNEDNQRYTLTDVIGVRKSDYSKYYFTLNDKLIKWLTTNDKHIMLAKALGILSYLSAHERNMLNEMNAKCVHPLIAMNRLTGLILFGQKPGGRDFSNDEIEMIRILLDQAAIAFENASLFQNQKDRLKKMYRADRLAMIGQLAAGAAHEIRNPLTSIRSTIQYVRKDIKDPVKAQMTTELLSEVDRINDIIQGLLSFSNPDKLNRQSVNLRELIKQSTLLIHNTSKMNHCKVHFDYRPDCTELFADPSQLKQVFLNILMNAIQAINEEGEISIIVESNQRLEKDSIRTLSEFVISIIDNGEGIAQENLEKIFDPFYTTKDYGTGLGLSISYGIIIQHGGDITIESELGVGTKVIVKVPAAQT